MSKAEQIAINADGPAGYRENESNVMFESNIMDRQSYTSCKTVEDCSKYAVGVVHGKEIHITPVKGKKSVDLHMFVNTNSIYFRYNSTEAKLPIFRSIRQTSKGTRESRGR